jgi:outer membrane receptor protein involved in Fe transport
MYNDPDSVSLTNTTTLTGVRAFQHFIRESYTSTFGVDAQQASSPTNSTRFPQDKIERASVFIKTELTLLDAFFPIASVRVEQRDHGSELSYGFGLTALLGDAITAHGEYRVFSNSSQLYTMSVEFLMGDASRLTLSAYQRSRGDGISFIPILLGREPEGQGGTAKFAFHWKQLEAFFTGGFLESFDSEFPKWSGAGEFAYRDVVLKDVMELRTGVRMRYSSKYNNHSYIPLYGFYLENPPDEIIGQIFTLDIFAIAHLGDAFLTLSIENLLDKEYMTVSRYPMPGRTFRLGFNWTFFD